MANRKFGWHSGAVHCKSIKIGGGTIVSGETHVSDMAASGVLASGKGLVGQNIVLTTLGTAGSWACGLYVKIVQGSTKNVNGYLNAAEFELVSSCVNASDFCVIALNSSVTASSCQDPAFIYIRDYGTLGLNNNLFWFGPEITIGSGSATALVTTATDHTATHNIKIKVGSTVMWLLATTTAP
jgi:hypothetical protein